ncbi:MAG: hypothetical protein GY953_12315 [bacterium]|nr:hypothetical protein [bacterium]
MKHLDAYLESGRPIIGLRTATHGFRYKAEVKTAYRSWSHDAKDWKGGFGKQVLGETWAGHHGHHAVQSTRGLIAGKMKDHPIVRGTDDIWAPSDVYVADLSACDSCQPLVLGQVLEGMKPTDKPIVGKYSVKRRDRVIEKTPNDPMMPVAWTKTFKTKSGKTSRIFTTTMGASVDLASEGLRRLVVNAAYWCVGMEDKIPARANVDIVGAYNPTMFGFGKFTPGVKPSAHALER